MSDVWSEVEPAGIPHGRVRAALLWTTVANVLVTLLAAAGGLTIAITLGPDGRGHYAALMVWFGLALVLGEVGQSSAATYFVARDSARAPDIVATSRNLILYVGGGIALLGIFLAPALAHHNRELAGYYRVLFLACLPSFAGAAYSFSLQSRSIARWNIVRFSAGDMSLSSDWALWPEDDPRFRGVDIRDHHLWTIGDFRCSMPERWPHWW